MIMSSMLKEVFSTINRKFTTLDSLTLVKDVFLIKSKKYNSVSGSAKSQKQLVQQANIMNSGTISLTEINSSVEKDNEGEEHSEDTDMEDNEVEDEFNELPMCLNDLLAQYQPLNCDCEILYDIDEKKEDRISAVSRDYALNIIRQLNYAYFGFPIKVFTLAADIMDKFITTVRVKPKYTSSVTAAAYMLSLQECQRKGILSPESIPNISSILFLTQCCKLISDLEKIMNIIISKLSFEGYNNRRSIFCTSPIEFVESVLVLEDSFKNTTIYNESEFMYNKFIHLLQCNLGLITIKMKSHIFHPSCIAISCIFQAIINSDCEFHQCDQIFIDTLMKKCNVNMKELVNCKELMLKKPEIFIQNHSLIPNIFSNNQRNYSNGHMKSRYKYFVNQKNTILDKLNVIPE